MTLIEMELALRAEVNRAPHQRFFERAREEDERLAGCATPTELLATLEKTSAEGYPEREALIRGAIAAYQRAPHSFWSALLIFAFLPMLRHLVRRAIGTRKLDDGELEQTVLARFLGVLAKYDLTRHSDKTFARIRSATEDALFADLVAEQSERAHAEQRPLEDIESLIDERAAAGLGAWPAHSQPRRRGRVIDVTARTTFLREHAAPHLNDEQMELVMATLGRGESIADFVRAKHPEVPDAERQRIYQRLKRCHSRAVRRLRDVLGPPAVDASDEGLAS